MAHNTRYRAKRRQLEEINTDWPNAELHVVLLAEELPAEMYYQIFRHLDKKSLKKSREVCKTWRNVIDGNSKLMKSLTIKITSINKFLKSSLATKVKSVSFTLPLASTEKLLEEFFAKIGPTVEKIVLKFVRNLNLNRVDKTKKMERQKLVFSMMLRFCTKLNSLTINSTDDNYDFVKNCSEDPRNLLALSTIEDLSINVKTKYLEDLRKFVENLPNLRRLILNFNNDYLNRMDIHNNPLTYLNLMSFVGIAVQNELCNLVLDHLWKYNGKLQEILIEEDSINDGGIVIKLLLMVGQLFPQTNVKCQARLNNLVNIQESEAIQVNQQSCRAIKDGLIQFHNNHDLAGVDTSRIGFCTNLQSLVIEIYQFPVNFRFIELNKLEYLRIVDRRLQDEGDNFMSRQFLSGIPTPTLTKFEFHGTELGLNSFPFHLCFPNLTKLCIRFIENYSHPLNADFVYNLTNLDQLRSLTLENLEELTDEHLTRVYDFTDENKIAKLPAIAGFERLRHLHIVDCVKLTDACLTNGLALCDKLDKITLCYNKYGDWTWKLTNGGLSFLQEAKNYFVEDLHCSHLKTHSSLWLQEYYVFKRFTTITSASVLPQ